MAHVDEKTGRLIYDQITKPIVVQANYLASMSDDSRVDDLINIYTYLVMPWNWGLPPISHDEWGCFVDGELWFSSATSRKELGTTDKTGTRWIKGKKLLRHPERWRLQTQEREPLSGSINSITACIIRANSLMGCRYDFYGVAADFINPLRLLFRRWVTWQILRKIKRIYCSKFVHVVDAGWLIVISPKRRFRVARKSGFIDVGDTETYLIMQGVVT